MKRIQDWLSLALGACLLLSPAVLGYADESLASWNAVIAGVLIGALAVYVLAIGAEWGEWTRLAVGLWAIVAPWVLGFASVAAAAGAHVLLGALVALLSAWRLWEVRRKTQTAM